jgi:hypothetical protein
MPGLGKKTFTAGDVLIAGDVNNYLMDQTVMNFASAAARSSAIPTPSTGMTSYRSDINQIESYDGSAWRGPTGLQLVKKQTVGTAVASVIVTDAFSATYDNYKIVYTGGIASGNTSLLLQMGATTTGYYSGFQFIDVGGVVQGATRNNHTAFDWAGSTTTSSAIVNIDVYQPFQSARTMATSSFIGATGAAPAFRFGSAQGILDNATSYSAFTIITSGTISGGTIYVYGYGI